jgi:hypothetical protein
MAIWAEDGDRPDVSVLVGDLGRAGGGVGRLVSDVQPPTTGPNDSGHRAAQKLLSAMPATKKNPQTRKPHWPLYQSPIDQISEFMLI